MPTNQVSIDRITVSGELKAEYWELQRDECLRKLVGTLWRRF